MAVTFSQLRQIFQDFSFQLPRQLVLIRMFMDLDQDSNLSFRVFRSFPSRKNPKYPELLKHTCGPSVRSNRSTILQYHQSSFSGSASQCIWNQKLLMVFQRKHFQLLGKSRSVAHSNCCSIHSLGVAFPTRVN